MVFDEVFSRFIEESPVSVMYRGVLENICSAERLDRMFEETAEKQVSGDLLFSTCADLLGLVVTGSHKSVNSAYRRRRKEVGVAVKSVYNKLSGIETAVSERMVRDTACDLTAIVENMGARCPSPLAGYEVRIVDGNHLRATDHRIKELRDVGAAPLPGHALAIWNPQTELIEDVITCEDGHASERSLFPQLLEKVERGQCWIEDRNFCTFDFLWQIKHTKKAYFVARQHGSLQGPLIGKRRKLGRIETGVVYEQSMKLTDQTGRKLVVRRITVRLDEPTRDGDQELHVLTNLPVRVSGKRIARLYADRWQIEAAFRELATALRSEINTLGYPRAALFGFCLAVVSYNVLNVVRGALNKASDKGNDGDKEARKFSTYYLSEEIAGVYRGMMIAIPAEHWVEPFATLTPKQLATKLLWLAKQVDFDIFYTNPYIPKPTRREKKPQRRRKGKHVSTYKLLQTRTTTRK